MSKEMTMLTRIASLVAALALSWVAPAEAGAPAKSKVKPEAVKNEPDLWRSNVKQQPRPEYRRHPVQTVQQPKPMTQPVTDEGRIEELEDGAIRYSVALSLETRQSMAKARHLPINKIPERAMKMARIDRSKLSTSMVKNRIGQDVILELRQDALGFVYVTNFLIKK
jgi:hypothetical protein